MKKPFMTWWIVGLSAAGLSLSCAQKEPIDQEVSYSPAVAKRHYVAFPSLGSTTPLQVAGVLNIPTAVQGKMPAVLITHGSSGVDSRGTYHAEELNKAGIATLEIDMWAARGLAGGSEARPATVQETLPDAYGALKFLSAHPSIDPARIGIMGFSWGGVMSMLTATQKYAAQAAPGQQFVAHAPFYPLCWGYNVVPGYDFANLTGAPLFIQAGSADEYDDPDSCQKLVDNLSPADRAHVMLTVYPGATHGFDRLAPAVDAEDSYSHKGQGGIVHVEPSPEAAEASRRAVVAFFQKSFGMAP